MKILNLKMASEITNLYIITACVIGFIAITICGICFNINNNKKSVRNTYIEI
jgi:hypothetical protein